MRLRHFLCIMLFASALTGGVQSAWGAQPFNVTGTVVDEVGEPLIGVTILEEGTKIGTITGANGEYAVKVSAENATLLFSYIGYGQVAEKVGRRRVINVQLSPASESLEEVIVVGSGTQKKVSVTGSISTVSGDALKMPATMLTRALGGRIAGVITKQNSGEPGTGADFYIRGISTFGGKTTPLILLDDVEISATDLNYIPAENIASFTVLKDASATAIYGARGANGVMIVTTKGGDFNTKTKVNITVENSFNFISKAPDLVGGVDLMNFYNWVNEARNPGSPALFSQEKIERTASGINPLLYPDVDWKSELLRDVAMRQRANFNVSGGSSKIKYYMSLDAQHENGLQNSDSYYSWNNNQQVYNYTFQNNISYKATRTTRLSLNMNTQIRQQSGPDCTSEWLIRQLGENCNPVDFPVYWPEGPNGEIRYATKKFSDKVTFPNPKYELNSTYAQTNYSTVNAVLKLDQDLDFITKGLKLNAWVNWKTYSSMKFTRHITPYLWHFIVDDGCDVNAPIEPEIVNKDANQFITDSGITRGSNNTFEFQANLNWARKFGEHDLTGLLMFRMREYRANSWAPNRNEGLSGRITYDYGHRYLAEFNFGYNGTERLARKHRFGFFPAASIGWVISNERFWEPLSDVVSHLKIRGSYGLVGSDDLAQPNGTYFLYQDKLQNDNLSYWGWISGDGDSSITGLGPMIRYYALNDVVWEKSRKLDIGADFTLFRKLDISAEYFRENRYDIFMQRGAWPNVMGYGIAVPWANVGKALNQGFEMSMNLVHAFSPELSVSFQGNLTYNQNKFVNVDEPTYSHGWMYKTGLPLDKYRMTGYIAEGLFTSPEDIADSPEQMVGSSNLMVGDIKYKDLNGDGKVDTSDQTMISKYGSIPRLMYGFGATVNWRKWDFGFFFTGAGCRTIDIQGQMNPKTSFVQQRLNVFRWTFENAYNPEKGNIDAKYPLPGVSTNDSANNENPSTYWLRDGSYLRLRSVELGWSFKYGRVYASGMNLLCFSGFKIWDPELDNPYKYPLQRTVNVGVQFNL